jgi:hypothetical protein
LNPGKNRASIDLSHRSWSTRKGLKPDLIVKGESMGLIELALILSVMVALYNIQQIKITLKERGCKVEMLTGWLRDYRQYKALIQSESDSRSRAKLQKTINGLHFSLAGIAMFVFMLL